MKDAEAALQYAVGLRTLTAEQLIAGDVTGNGTVTSQDASLILQFALGLQTSFPASSLCGSDWAFFPTASALPNQALTEPVLLQQICTVGAIKLNPLSGSASARNFRAIQFGDIVNQ
jgi:hypothetical protein